MVKKTAEQSYGELSELKPRQNFRLGDITWVKHGTSSWWPAQVIDEASASNKPKKKTIHDALVRLYGTCQYLYVDPWKSKMEFEMILKEENKTAMEAFHHVLQKELTHLSSPSDDDDEPVSTKAKTSVRKASAEGRDKTQKQASVDKKGRKAVTSVVRKEGARQSGRTSAKKYSDASEDSTSQLHDTSASEDAAEVGDITSVNRRQRKKVSAVDGTDREIKAMVRDMLLGDVVARQHASVDDVIFRVSDATVGMVAHGTTEGGRSIKRTGGGLEADSSNDAKRPRKGNTKPNNSNSSPSRDVAAMEGREQHSSRQIKIMQKLGLVAPPGSPFKGLAVATHR
ncbi:DNA (cytosine-5)-methyltransferase 3B-like [Lolium rigidum]|uniref:DNA (cytosine-5)-methyltransferase 3B-like n=1 Tax=Lolium rigidum TaxID=89674 RepID=UPI001F5C8591|nr:DNA (cytosine-5)-methyltransferase 3B-like [Lolium rigidum]